MYQHSPRYLNPCNIPFQKYMFLGWDNPNLMFGLTGLEPIVSYLLTSPFMIFKILLMCFNQNGSLQLSKLNFKQNDFLRHSCPNFMQISLKNIDIFSIIIEQLDKYQITRKLLKIIIYQWENARGKIYIYYRTKSHNHLGCLVK